MKDELKAKVNKDKNTEKNDVVEIDLKQLWFALIRRIWILLITAFIGAAVFFTGTKLLITPEYKSYVQVYVNNNSFSLGGDTLGGLTSSDIMASKSLVDTYIVILRSRNCLNDVVNTAGVDYSYGQVRNMISAYSVNETEVFEIAVTSTKPEEAEKIANAIAEVLPKKIAGIVQGTSAEIVDYAIKPSSPSSPNAKRNTLLGFVLGFAITAVIIVIRTIFDTTIRSEEDVTQTSDHPVLASVPDMVVQSKGGYYSTYGKKKGGYYSSAYASASKKAGNKSAVAGANEEVKVIGKDISFAASEAYKLLRTKLQFSFVDDVKCPVIGISSAMAGEGKSLSAINLAYSLAQLEKRVLLIDCDMRRPSVFNRLPVQKAPGLSNYLTNQVERAEVIQKCKLDDEQGFDVIASGNNPPNPIELISSVKMSNVLEDLRDYYDYIIVDLPPVGEVSDALVAAKLVDGMLIVVRQDYCTTTALSDAVDQFEFIESKILGIVMNCISEGGSKYGKRYYKKYYSKYKYHNYAYAAASAKARSKHSSENKKD